MLFRSVIISSIFFDIFDDPILIVVSLFIATIGMVIFTFKNVVNTQKFLDKKQYKEAYLSSVRNRKFNKIIFIFAAVFFIIGIILD